MNCCVSPGDGTLLINRSEIVGVNLVGCRHFTNAWLAAEYGPKKVFADVLALMSNTDTGETRLSITL